MVSQCQLVLGILCEITVSESIAQVCRRISIHRQNYNLILLVVSVSQ